MQAARQETTYRMADGVVYRKVGEHTYVRNARTRTSFMYNRIAGEILDLLKQPSSVDLVFDALARKYSIKDISRYRLDIESFMDEIESARIIDRHDASADGKKKSPGIEDRFKSLCLERGQLWNATFELTYLCNERCVHCYLDDANENSNIGVLSYDECRSALDQLADMGCMNILVTGGEPTLHPDFTRICQYAVSKGFLLDIFTNALSIHEDMFDALVALDANSISFSLYGGTPQFHDSITKVQGSFDKSLKNIMMLKCAGADVFIKTVIFNKRIDEYEKLKRLADRLKIPVAPATVIVPGHSGSCRSDLSPDQDTLSAYFHLEAMFTSDGTNPDDFRRNLEDPLCSAGITSIAIRPNGDIVPCIRWPCVLGNIKHDSLLDVWRDSPELAEIRKITFASLSQECTSCKYSGFCHVCPGVSYSERNGVVGPSSYSCLQARIRHDEANKAWRQMNLHKS